MSHGIRAIRDKDIPTSGFQGRNHFRVGDGTGLQANADLRQLIGDDFCGALALNLHESLQREARRVAGRGVEVGDRQVGVIFSWGLPSKPVGVSGTGPRGIETGEKKTRNVFDLSI